MHGKGSAPPKLPLSATSPHDFESESLQASLQESVHLPGESSVPRESLLWKTGSVVLPTWAEEQGFEIRQYNLEQVT